jgi:hypothetical protein
MTELEKIAERVRAGKQALSALKTARDFISNKTGKEKIDEKIRKAEDTLNRCSARIATLTEKK